MLSRRQFLGVADLRFVLDRLGGAGPVGVFGHSLGGATAAQLMHDDRRVRAGIDLDGTLYGPVTTAGLDRPFPEVTFEGQRG